MQKLALIISASGVQGLLECISSKGEVERYSHGKKKGFHLLSGHAELSKDSGARLDSSCETGGVGSLHKLGSLQGV